MTRLGTALLAAVLLSAAFPAAAMPQAPSRCVLVLDRAPRWERVLLRNGAMREYGGGGVQAHCRGRPTRMRADSVAILTDLGRVDFVGNVWFADSAVTLESERSVYFLDDERLESYRNVRLEDESAGSVLLGQNLTYWRQVPGLRDSTELYATQRPTVQYRAGSDSTDAEPYVIVGNQLRMRGQHVAWVGGAVTIDRSDFHATGDSTELHLGEGRGLLLGHAFVESRSGEGDSSALTVSGREIAFLFPESELTWVQSRALADATSAEWRIVADTLEFTLAGGMVQGGLAWGDSIRAQAVSKINTITADSIAIDTPDQVLTEIRAYRQARAVSVRDSLDSGSDWVVGDTVTVRFDAPDGGERILSALEAEGNAHAFYRIFDPEVPGAEPDINYSRGVAIRARFTAAGVNEVVVVGAADGVHLEPIGRQRRP